MSSKALPVAPNIYSRILELFPSKHLSFCFAYGSGVFQQANTAEKANNMIDLIFAVQNPTEWHEENLERNKSHYSNLSLLGHTVISQIQTNFPAKVYFNSMIPISSENVTIKYGVISHKDLQSDLVDWDQLYIAGRLHKPVKIITDTADAQLKKALKQNLNNAVHAALLLLPEHFTEAQFYRQITSLSYMGDFRMTFGEDVNKIDNIVQGHLEEFRKLYDPVVKTLSNFLDIPKQGTDSIVVNGEENCSQDLSPKAKHHHLNQLPRYPQRQLVRYWNRSSNHKQDTEDVLRSMAYEHDCGTVVGLVLSRIVWDSSVQQSIKGILTAGVGTSFKYSARKIIKMVESRRRINEKDI